MGRHDKRPKTKNPLRDSKEVRTEFQFSSDKEKLAWSLGRLDVDGRWGWHAIEHSLWWGDIHSKLCGYESMTWAQIVRHKHCHSEIE